MNTDELKKERLIARKEKQSTKVDAINYVLAAVETIEMRSNKTMTDDEVMNTIKKVVAELNETYEMYNDGKHEQGLADCTSKIDVLKEYLPTELSDEEIVDAVSSAIKEAEATTMRDMGKVMGLLAKYGTSLDKGKASKLVKEQLS